VAEKNDDHRALRARAMALVRRTDQIEAQLRDALGQLASVRTNVNLILDELDAARPVPTAE
jgi:SOS response regulatory protein OraA/RecX